MPLLAYYRSYSGSGEAPPPLAVDALAGAVARVPAAPAPRLPLGAELGARGLPEEAAKVLRPVAEGAYDSPERARARALLQAAEAARK
jgi:hypothetical protein